MLNVDMMLPAGKSGLSPSVNDSVFIQIVYPLPGLSHGRRIGRLQTLQILIDTPDIPRLQNNTKYLLLINAPFIGL
jgi:hypothetical protein